MLRVGLIGLPNVGKSTVFNALSKAGAKVSNYPFCTVEPNHGIVSAPDPRLDTLGRIFHQQKVVPAAVEFVDIAGLVKGASRGEGLGNQFLHHLREVDAVLQVVRCFPAADITHIEGDIDPVRDVEIVNLELALSDLARTEKREEELKPKARSGETATAKQIAVLGKIAAALGAGRPATTAPLSKEEWHEFADLNLLTAKPTLYLANVSEEEAKAPQPDSPRARLEAYLAGRGEMMVVMSAKIEADLAELAEEERAEFIADLGVEPVGEQVIAACYRLLNLITFFTGVGAEVRAWAIPAGTRAQDAAGKIHSDMARGFIRAEVISFAELERIGSWEKARSEGHLRLEGKNHIINEGDVCYFRFSL